MCHFSPADIHDLLDLVNHPSVADEIQQVGTNEGEILAYIETENTFQPYELHKIFDLGIERRKDGKVIGIMTAIIKHHRKLEIGYALGNEHRCQGYVAEAARALIDYGFSELGLHCVQFISSGGNPPSFRIIERLGVKLEGRLREANMRNGKWSDLLYCGLLKDEWHPT